MSGDQILTKKFQNKYDFDWLMAHCFGYSIPKRRALNHPETDAFKGQVIPIERRKNLSIEEFKRVYLKGGIPVIFQGGAKHWDCTKKWTPDYLADHYGDDPILLIDASPKNMDDINYQPAESTLREVVSQMEVSPIKMYSRFNRLLHTHPELRQELDMAWLLRHRNVFASGKTFQLFIGGKGSCTHLHAASEHNLFVQAYGRKHWVLYPPQYDGVLRPPVDRAPYFRSVFNPDQPDYTEYPDMAYLDRYECTLEAGDILFNPPSWWHHVTNLSGSIGVGFRWFAPVDAFKADRMQALLTLLATSPPIWTATKYRTDFSKIFGKMRPKSNP